ncbi:MAG: translocation/assembly module TamB domain-containing protein, partial [Gammaproteobacteria bacterium]
RLALDFDIEAPDLAALYPGLAGRAGGAGRLGGSPQRPELMAQLAADELRFDDTVTVERIALDARWQGDGGALRLDAANGRAGDFAASRLALRLDGTPEGHRLNADLAAEGLAVNLAAHGAWQTTPAEWRGTLEALTVAQAQAGSWALEAPARLRLAAAKSDVGRACLVQEPARVCVEGAYAPARLQGEVRIEGLPLQRLAQGLPEHIGVEGELAGRLLLGGAPANPRVTLRLTPSDGRLIFVEDETDPLGLRFEDVALEAEFADDRGHAELRMLLDGDGVTRGRVTLGPGPNREIGGKVSAHFPDLSLVSGIVPDLTQVAGRLLLDLELGGRLAAPRLRGELRIAEGSADLAAAGLELRDLALSVTGDGSGPLQLAAEVSSGGGRLTARGTLDPTAQPGPAVRLGISGDRVLAARLPEASVRVSPDLRLTGSKPYHLAGELHVPEALIELESLPQSSVRVSEDEVVVGEDAEASAAVHGPPGLTTDVRVSLGEQVRFEGFGLATRLEGAVDARVDERGSRLDGRIELAGGVFEAFGQKLTIEQGRLLFAGPPSRPEIDLRAMRLSLDQRVRAYLSANGPIREPRTRVYSDPALPQAEALAYLLTGRGLDQADQREGLDIASAALTLGLSRGEPLLQNMGARLGLDELRIATGENGVEGSSLVVGKYLNPDLYVGLSQNIFDPTGSILLRLRLSDHVEVETRAGESQSVDLFYRVEHE